jgi:putative ABC transport system ATP-binding protein
VSSVSQNGVVLDARDIWKTYRGDGADVRALRGVSLSLRRGEFAALTGPSGCGKSTLLNIVACVDTPTTGTVTIEGREVSSLNDDQLTGVRRTSIGYVFQFFNLMPTLTIFENVALPLVLAGAKKRDIIAAVTDALARVEVHGLEDRRPSSLSGGQQQRVAIARAIAHRPAIVLADEPTGNLDSATGREVLTLLRRLSDDQGTTVLMATHATDATVMADRIVRMRDGAIEA